MTVGYEKWQSTYLYLQDTAVISISRHSFVWDTKKRRLRFSKPPFQMGVLIELLHDGFFSFAVVRQICVSVMKVSCVVAHNS